MSDPAKTPEEIEDVLASIRRLVSDTSPVPDADAPIAEAAEIPAAVIEERLVLTPSFRVADPEDPWVPVAVAQADDDAVDPSATTDDGGWQPDDRLAHFDAVGDEDETAELSFEPSEEDIADLLQLDGARSQPAEFEPETGDDNWPGTGAEAALLTLVARREPVENLAEETPQEDDTSSEHEPAHDTARDEQADGVSEVDIAEEMADADDADSDAEDQAFADASAEDVPDDAISETVDDDETSEEDASLDAALSEDDVSDETAYDTDDSAVEGVELPSGGPTPTPVFSGRAAREDVVDDLGDEPSPFGFPETEDGILDEETLREIIVDVVREELQGVLGQRITRNVRKMVRREVRLALAAEDLE